MIFDLSAASGGWNGTLFDNGNQYQRITGGWNVYKTFADESYVKQFFDWEAEETLYAESTQVYGTEGEQYLGFNTRKGISFAYKKKLKFHGDFTSWDTGAGSTNVILRPAHGGDLVTFYITSDIKENGYDVSELPDDNYYVYVYVTNQHLGTSFRMYKIWLE